MNKYRNRRVTVDGISFDSVREAQRYRELKLLERSGKISGLELQKKFVLIPAQYGEYAQTQQEAPQTHGKGKPSQTARQKSEHAPQAVCKALCGAGVCLLRRLFLLRRERKSSGRGCERRQDEGIHCQAQADAGGTRYPHP